MKNCLFIILFNFCSFVSYSDEYRIYDFEPILIEKGSRISLISNIDENNIIVAGSKTVDVGEQELVFNSTIFKSTDGGMNWKECYLDTNEKLINAKRFPYTLRKLHYLSKDKILAFYSDGYVLKSEDGGESWKRDSIDLALYFYNSKFIDDKNGILLCSRNLGPFKSKWEFIRTTDGGESWKEFVIPIDSIFNKPTILFISNFSYKSDIFQFIQKNSESLNDSINNISHYIVKSIDNGITWQKKLLFSQDSVNYRVQNSYKYISSNVQFINQNEAIWFGAIPSQTLVDGSNNSWQFPFIRKSKDGGETWEELFYDQDSSVRSNSPSFLIYTPKNKYIFKGGSSGISVYELGKKKYVTVLPNFNNGFISKYNYSSISDFNYLGEDNYILTGNGDYIFRFNYNNSISSIDVHPSFDTMKLFPNPLKQNETLSLILNPYLIGIATITVIDINGRTISSFDWNLTSISETLELKPNINMTSGLYFVQIEYQNGIIDRQKFIVN